VARWPLQATVTTLFIALLTYLFTILLAAAGRGHNQFLFSFKRDVGYLLWSVGVKVSSLASNCYVDADSIGGRDRVWVNCTSAVSAVGPVGMVQFLKPMTHLTVSHFRFGCVMGFS